MGVGHGVHCSQHGQNQKFSSSGKISSVHSSHLYSLNIKNGEIRRQNGQKERHTRKEIPKYRLEGCRSNNNGECHH